MDFELAKFIDHTLLRPEASDPQIERLCQEALQFRFASVCVNPCKVVLAAALLNKSGIPVCTVIGFPLGAATTETKVFETRQALELGAAEFDMVISLGAVKTKEFDLIQKEIEAVVKAAQGHPVKVILETALLNEEEMRAVCNRAELAKAHFVKTSTGFGPGGATVESVSILNSAVGGRLGVKASGGIKDRETARKMIAAGATRIGTSSGVQIVQI